MKFVHLSDTHLGKNEMKLDTRKEDFNNAFKQAIDFALDKKVDFVIHSGDLFDIAKPSVDTLIFAAEQLKRLKENNIPFFIAVGSHDIGVDDTIISLLEVMGLLINVSSKKHYLLEGEKIIMLGEKINNVSIYGIAGKRAKIDEIFRNLVPKDLEPNHFNIFIFHHIISDISEKFMDLPVSLLPKNFDYYAGGHWHGFFESKYGKGKIVYPGSTEYNDLKEMESDQAKYFCFVTQENGKLNVEKIKIKTREIKILEINCNNADALEVTKEVISKITPNQNKAILIIKLLGKLSKGNKLEIDRKLISDTAEAQGYLYAKIYLSDLENPETPFVSSRKSSAEIEEEYLVKQKYEENEVLVAKQLISLLGKEFTPSELKAKQLASKEVIRRLLIDN